MPGSLRVTFAFLMAWMTFMVAMKKCRMASGKLSVQVALVLVAPSANTLE